MGELVEGTTWALSSQQLRFVARPRIVPVLNVNAKYMSAKDMSPITTEELSSLANTSHRILMGESRVSIRSNPVNRRMIDRLLGTLANDTDPTRIRLIVEILYNTVKFTKRPVVRSLGPRKPLGLTRQKSPGDVWYRSYETPAAAAISVVCWNSRFFEYLMFAVSHPFVPTHTLLMAIDLLIYCAENFAPSHQRLASRPLFLEFVLNILYPKNVIAPAPIAVPEPESEALPLSSRPPLPSAEVSEIDEEIKTANAQILDIMAFRLVSVCRDSLDRTNIERLHDLICVVECPGQRPRWLASVDVFCEMCNMLTTTMPIISEFIHRRIKLLRWIVREGLAVTEDTRKTGAVVSVVQELVVLPSAAFTRLLLTDTDTSKLLTHILDCSIDEPTLVSASLCIYNMASDVAKLAKTNAVDQDWMLNQASFLTLSMPRLLSLSAAGLTLDVRGHCFLALMSIIRAFANRSDFRGHWNELLDWQVFSAVALSHFEMYQGLEEDTSDLQLLLLRVIKYSVMRMVSVDWMNRELSRWIGHLNELSRVTQSDSALIRTPVGEAAVELLELMLSFRRYPINLSSDDPLCVNY